MFSSIKIRHPFTVRSAIFVALSFTFLLSDVSAEAPEVNRQELLNIIKTQQQQLDQQQQALDAQGKLLKQLEQQVKELARQDNLTPAAETNAPAAKSQNIAKAQSVTKPDPARGKPQPTQIAAEQTTPAWPGSFSVLGSETRFLIDGFVQLDIMIDDGTIATPCDFTTGAIPTSSGANAQGDRINTNYCINTSRLNLSSQTPTSLGLLGTFFSVDLYGDSTTTTPDLRLREAYGELHGGLWGGDLLVGHAWSTYTDLAAWPDVLDFQGPGSAIAVRQPMVRWTKPLSDNYKLQVALEQPGGGSVQGGNMLRAWPDLVSTLAWHYHGGYIRAAGILRDIRADASGAPVANKTGWGLAASGSVALPLDSSILFEATYGKGVGAYYNDGPINGVYDPLLAKIDLVGVFGYYAGINHNWTPQLSSSILFSSQNADTLASQPGTDGKKTSYYSLNLIWRPTNSLMFGAELLSGSRHDINGDKGKDNRLQISSNFSF